MRSSATARSTPTNACCRRASRNSARRRRPRTSNSQDEINKRVAELKARVDQNDAELTAEQNNLLAWRVRKRQEEDRIAEAVGYFVSENPITTSGAPSDKGGSNVR